MLKKERKEITKVRMDSQLKLSAGVVYDLGNVALANVNDRVIRAILTSQLLLLENQMVIMDALRRIGADETYETVVEAFSEKEMDAMMKEKMIETMKSFQEMLGNKD